MGVRVNDAGHHAEAGGIKLDGSLLGDVTDCNDATLVDSDVAVATWRACPIENVGISDHVVDHEGSTFWTRWRTDLCVQQFREDFQPRLALALRIH